MTALRSVVLGLGTPLIFGLPVSPASAQVPMPGALPATTPRDSAVIEARARLHRSIRLSEQGGRGHWREGLVIGALAGAVAAQVFLSIADRGTYSTGERVGVSVIMAVPGAVIGAFIGNAIKE